MEAKDYFNELKINDGGVEASMIDGSTMKIDKNGDVVIENATVKLDHPYNQRFIIQESFTPKKFLWYNYKSEVVRTVIPTGLCEECSLPREAHE